MALNSHRNVSTHPSGDVLMNQVYSIPLCFLTQQSSLLHFHSLFAPLFYSYYFSPSWDLHFHTCTFWKKKAYTLFIHKKQSLHAVWIPWAITCKIILQIKEKNSELLLPPYSTRSLGWMQKYAEWKNIVLGALGCLRHRHRVSKSDPEWSTPSGLG